MPVYARAGVTWFWLLDPLARYLEVFHLVERKRFAQEQTFAEGDVVRASPFELIELDLTALWEASAPEVG